MPDAITILIADLKESRYSSAQQNIIVPVDDFVAALNEIETAIGGGITPSTIVLTDNHILVGNVLNQAADVAMSGDATIVTGGALTIGASKVTYAKIQNESTVTLLGNPTGAPAAPSEITLGTNLSFAGSVLNATGGGNVVGPAGAVASNFASFDGVTGLLLKDSGAAPGSFDVAGAAATAQSNAEAYTDSQINGGTPGTISPPAISLPTAKIVKGDGSAHGSAVFDLTDIVLVLDGGGVALASGARFNVFIDFAGTIQEVTMLADQSGSVALDIQTCSFANYAPGTHPVSGDSIVNGGTHPSISAASKYQDATLTSWTLPFSAGCFSLTATGGATSITRVTCSIKVAKS